MVYMGIMTPSVPPVLFCVGCIPGPPMVGLMPGIGPPCNNDSHGYQLSYSGPHYPPLPFLVNSPHRQGRSSSPRWSSLLHARVEEPSARISRVFKHSWGDNNCLQYSLVYPPSSSVLAGGGVSPSNKGLNILGHRIPKQPTTIARTSTILPGGNPVSS